MSTFSPLTGMLQIRLIKRLRRYEPTDKRLKEAMMRAGMLIENETKLNLRRGGTGPNKQAKGLIDTGALWNSIFHSVQQKDKSVILTAGSRGIVYAAMHEFGGTIVPVRAKALTIPLTKEAKERTARDFTDTFIIGPNIRGNSFIARLVGGSIERLYLLRQSVVIPARPYLAPAIKDTMPKIIKLIRQVFRKK